MDPISLALKLGTAGSNSPISLSGSPVSSASHPIIAPTVSFGAFQIGGKGNDAAQNLPTPNSLFGQTPGTVSNSTLLIAAGAALLLILVLGSQ